MVKEAMEKAETFDEAVKMLQKTKTIDPIYYIVSGPGVNDGVVIEKDRHFVKATY